MRIGTNLIRSSLARVLGTMAGMAVAFVMMPFLVSHLGDRTYGIWIIVAGISGYYYVLDFGLSLATSRYLAAAIARRESQGVNEIVNTSLTILASLGLVLLGLAGIICYFAERFVEAPSELSTIRAVILIMAASMAVGFPFKAFGGIIFAKLRYDLVEYFSVLKLVGQTAAVLYFIGRGHGILTLAIIGAVAEQGYNLVFYLLAKHLWPDLRLGLRFFRRELTRELFGYSVWSFLNMMSDNVRFKIDALVIGGLRSARLVTHYSIGARLAEYSLMLIFRATNLLTPVFTRYHALDDYTEIRSKVLLFSRINAALGLFGGGLMLVLGRPFISRWMGQDYLDAYPVVAILIIGIIVEAIHKPATNVLFAIAKHRFYALSSTIEAVANLTLSIVLIGKFGIVGVAAATTIPQVVNRLFIIPAYMCRRVELSWVRYYVNLVPTVLLTVAYIGVWHAVTRDYLINPGYGVLALCTIAAVPLYAALCFFFLFSKDERRFFVPKGFFGNASPEQTDR